MQDFTDDEFTFQYVSIKTISTFTIITTKIKFTFQYVSIKTLVACSRFCELAAFTFQYVSIKTDTSFAVGVQSGGNLHSNMFLLRQR